MAHHSAHPSPGRSPHKALLLVLAATLLALPLQAGAQEPLGEAPAAAQAEELLPPIPDPPSFSSGVSETLEDFGGDLFYWGQGATLTGTYADNVFAGGQTVRVNSGATIKGDLFAWGATVFIDGEILNDAYIGTGSATIGPDAVIHGNIICFCGSLQVDGTVRGQISGGGGDTRILGRVGSLKVEAGMLTVGPEAVIDGDLEYEANDEANISESATIGGEVRRTINPDDEKDEDSSSGGISAWSIGWKLWGYLSKLLVGVAFLLVGGRVARLPAERLRETPAVGLGFGFVVAVVFPVACVVAILLIVSMPLGIIGLVLFGIAIFLASLVTSQYVGAWLLRRVGGGSVPSEYLALALGLLVLSLLALVPYLGFLIRLTAWLLGLGGMFLALRPAVGGGSGATPEAG